MNSTAPQECATIDCPFAGCLRGIRMNYEASIFGLWTCCEQRLRAICQRQLRLYRCCGIEDADDVANQVFETFVRKFQRGDFSLKEDAGPFWALLTTLARNASFDASRRYRSDRSLLIRDADTFASGQLAQFTAYFDLSFDRVDDLDFLQCILNRCSADVRRTVELLMVGKTHDQIASELHVAPSTVYRRLHRSQRRFEFR